MLTRSHATWLFYHFLYPHENRGDSVQMAGPSRGLCTWGCPPRALAESPQARSPQATATAPVARWTRVHGPVEGLRTRTGRGPQILKRLVPAPVKGAVRPRSIRGAYRTYRTRRVCFAKGFIDRDESASLAKGFIDRAGSATRKKGLNLSTATGLPRFSTTSSKSSSFLT